MKERGKLVEVGGKEGEGREGAYLADRRSDLGWRRDFILAVELRYALVVGSCQNQNSRINIRYTFP